VRPLDDVLEWLSACQCTALARMVGPSRTSCSALVREVIAELPTPHRAVIVLFLYGRPPARAIAHVLSCPSGR